MKKSMLAVVAIAVLGAQGCTVYVNAAPAGARAASTGAEGKKGNQGIASLEVGIEQDATAPVLMQRSARAADGLAAEPELPAATPLAPKRFFGGEFWEGVANIAAPIALQALFNRQ